MTEEALKDLLYKIADDLLILGHRNSEWTGVGPLLEEDIAFSSMAQDKVGQSLAFYDLLHQLGEQDPDTVAFTRNAEQFHNSQFVELPIGEYDFSLIRHFLYDHADYIRFSMLAECPIEEVSQIGKKLKGEIKYHVMHANTWIKQLATANEEAHERLQNSLNQALPYALGMFEPSKFEKEIVEAEVYPGEQAIEEQWKENIAIVLREAGLNLPEWNTVEPVYGGRYGKHTEYLQPLVAEMSEVFRVDPTADW